MTNANGAIKFYVSKNNSGMYSCHAYGSNPIILSNASYEEMVTLLNILQPNSSIITMPAHSNANLLVSDAADREVGGDNCERFTYFSDPAEDDLTITFDRDCQLYTMKCASTGKIWGHRHLNDEPFCWSLDKDFKKKA